MFDRSRDEHAVLAEDLMKGLVGGSDHGPEITKSNYMITQFC